MADTQGGKTGGNTPKPTGGSKAKDATRAQSRQISAKGPKGKSGSSEGRAKVAATAGAAGGGGGNKPRPGRQAAPVAAPRSRGMLWAWGAVAVVVVVIVVIVVVKVTGGSSGNGSYTPTVAAPASVVHDVTNIPLSVYDKVGVTSPTVTVNPPTPLKAQPSLTLDGTSPSMLYIGAEYCPFCAAERWAMTAALSRFGTWSGLQITASSHTDEDPATHTFSYAKASLSSAYINFHSVEMYTNIPTSNGFTTLESLTKAEQANAAKYSSSKYDPYASSQGGISFPYINIDNKYLISGASYDPAALSGLTWQDIAGDLSNPSNPVTQAIVTTANYISAGICAASKNAPADVCTSSGVQAATKALAAS